MLPRSFRPPVEAEAFTNENLENERYAELDPSKEAQLESIAGWYTPNVEEEEEAGEPHMESVKPS